MRPRWYEFDDDYGRHSYLPMLLFWAVLVVTFAWMSGSGWVALVRGWLR